MDQTVSEDNRLLQCLYNRMEVIRCYVMAVYSEKHTRLCIKLQRNIEFSLFTNF
jgi:hypothetical protein